MRVLFLHFGKLHVNSVIQAFHLGEEMTAEGIEVVLCGQGDTSRISTIGEPSFACINYGGLDRQIREWRRDPGETVICAWTPREVVRKATEKAARALDAPYVVHLEDNEEHLLSTALRLPYETLCRLPRGRQDELCTDDFIHPAHYPRLMENAAAVTVITEELNEFNVAGRPHQLAPPGVDHERFRPDLPPAISREELGLRPGRLRARLPRHRPLGEPARAVQPLPGRAAAPAARAPSQARPPREHEAGRGRPPHLPGAAPRRAGPRGRRVARHPRLPRSRGRLRATGGAGRLQPLPAALEAAGVPRDGPPGRPARLQPRQRAHGRRERASAARRDGARDRRPGRAAARGPRPRRAARPRGAQLRPERPELARECGSPRRLLPRPARRRAAVPA